MDDLYLKAPRPSDPRDLLVEVLKRESNPTKQKAIFRAMLWDDNKLLDRCLDLCFEEWRGRAATNNAAR